MKKKKGKDQAITKNKKSITVSLERGAIPGQCKHRNQRMSILASKVFNIGLNPVQLKNLQPILSVKASKCSKTSKSCKETSETKGPFKQASCN